MDYRYFKLCPRGFANEVIYFRVPEADAPEVDAYFAHYEDNIPAGRAGWTSDKRASMPGVAVDWADRAHAGF